MNLPSLSAYDFQDFSRELWGKNYVAFPWQRDFAERLCAGRIPDCISVPTGSGKTACLDAAVFALAVQSALPLAERKQGRRIFFIVNRRVIVDEAYDRAGKICKQLREADPSSVAGRVAAALRNLLGDSKAVPLKRVQLRGGIYRDRSWADSLLQPMIVCSTVDQTGSRLLFRGYGVSAQARPIHAALVAQDSLLIIDEAHISRPFIQTLQWVERYRLYQPAGAETVNLPFDLIQMTATPLGETIQGQKITLTPEDHENPILKRRLTCPKPARLTIEPKAKGKSRDEHLANRLVEEAQKMLLSEKPRSLAIMVNRVATARLIATQLEQKHGRVKLLIGRLRPLDKKTTTAVIQESLKTGETENHSDSEPLVVVSTQCLEVGADLDFDALITEAASLDALRQRFGRLNRGGRRIPANATIVLPADQDIPVEKLDDKDPIDFIYGNAIPRTWRWLDSLAQNSTIDFGINAMSAAVDSLLSCNPEEFEKMLSPTNDAPVLLPAYLDCWVQTNPAPAADPDVSLFLHGPQRDMAEVQVCWRGELPEDAPSEVWDDILSLCPPTSAECLPVPLHAFRDWLVSDGKFQDKSSDVVESERPIEKNNTKIKRQIPVFVWRGSETHSLVNDLSRIKPGDTIILRVQNGGWDALGHIPDAPDDPQIKPGKTLTPEEIRLIDLAENSTVSTRRRAVLRMHSNLLPESATTKLRKLLDPERSEDPSTIDFQELIQEILAEENFISANQELKTACQHLAMLRRGRIDIEPYPNNLGVVLSSRYRLPAEESGDLEETETNAEALLEAPEPQTLSDHTRDVLVQVTGTLDLMPLSRWREALIAATKVHDWGKADPRFQALLRGTTPYAVMGSTSILAKSGSIPQSAAARRAARKRAKLPADFRHELLSVQMAKRPAAVTVIPTDPDLLALVLYLVGTHHGYARPFAPVIEDHDPLDVNLNVYGSNINLPAAERHDHPPHAFDSGFAERFWCVNRRYGWWGIALLESVLRLADHYASAEHQTQKI